MARVDANRTMKPFDRGKFAAIPAPEAAKAVDQLLLPIAESPERRPSPDQHRRDIARNVSLRHQSSSLTPEAKIQEPLGLARFSAEIICSPSAGPFGPHSPQRSGKGARKGSGPLSVPSSP